MKKIFLVFLLLIVTSSIVSCKKTCEHTDNNLDCLCDKCNIEMHQYVDGECIKCHKSELDPSMYLEGTYALESAKLDNEDVTKNFSLFSVEFKKNLTMIVSIYEYGLLTKRESTYTRSGSNIVETYKNETFDYTYLNGKLYTTYDDLGDLIEITLKYVEVVDGNKPVDFESVLFGEDVSLTKIYNYCPAIIYDQDEDGNNIMHVWYCTNTDSGVIVDKIGYRVGTEQEDGKWKFTDEQIALEPTLDTWDGYHTCDPTVIKGKFNYKGEAYNYLMAYLGCVTTDYQKNETGLAIAKNPEGPWVKINEINPIVPWYDDGDYEVEQQKYESYKGTSNIYWGTGMPSLVSVDEKGEVLLFYQSTKRGTGLRRLDLSDIEHPIVKYTVTISGKGMLNSQNLTGRLGIADFAYDKTAKRFYVTGVTNEKNPADVTLTRVNSHSCVAYLDNIDSMETLSDLLQTSNYSWNMVGFIGPSETGWERNHNPGLVKDSFGFIPNSEKIQVIVSTGHNSWNNENIFTYRLFGWTFEIK